MPSIGTLIIGGGVSGAALAHALSQRGAGDGVALADIDLFGRYSASALCGGSVRSFFSHPLHRKLADASLAFYQANARRLDFVTRGGIRIDSLPIANLLDRLIAGVTSGSSNPAMSSSSTGSVMDAPAASGAVSLPAQTIAADQARGLHPHLGSITDRLTHCPADGRLSVHKLRLMLIQRAEAGGLQLLDRWQVVAIEGQGSPWRVTLRRVNPRQIRKTLSDGVAAVRPKPSVTSVALGGEEMVLMADRVVNAAGPWAAEIARLYGHDLPIASFPRQVFLLSSPSVQLEPCPWLIDAIGGLSVGYYRRDNKPLVFVTCMDLPRVGGIEYTFPGESYYQKHIRDRLLQRMPGLADAIVAGGWTSHDDLSPDFCPIVGPVPGKEGLFNLTGLSGHGLAMAPALSQAMAALLQKGSWPADLNLDAFSELRFSTDHPLAAHLVEPLWF